MPEHYSKPSRSKWHVFKVKCGCHIGRWVAFHFEFGEHEYFDIPQLALRYAIDPRFRAQIKAGHDLADWARAEAAATRSNA